MKKTLLIKVAFCKNLKRPHYRVIVEYKNADGSGGGYPLAMTFSKLGKAVDAANEASRDLGIPFNGDVVDW